MTVTRPPENELVHEVGEFGAVAELGAVGDVPGAAHPGGVGLAQHGEPRTSVITCESVGTRTGHPGFTTCAYDARG